MRGGKVRVTLQILLQGLVLPVSELGAIEEHVVI